MLPFLNFLTCFFPVETKQKRKGWSRFGFLKLFAHLFDFFLNFWIIFTDRNHGRITKIKIAGTNEHVLRSLAHRASYIKDAVDKGEFTVGDLAERVRQYIASEFPRELETVKVVEATTQ